MRYGIAVWNYKEPDVTLPALVESFAEDGFDAVALSLQALALAEAAEIREVAAVLRRRGLVATLHGNFERTPAEIERVVSLLGGTVAAVTFDAAMALDSRGSFFDVARMAAVLLEIERLSRGTELRFGIEDFPLDAAALDHYRAGLAPLLECPRYGILIDVGHMNMRRRTHAYFQGLSVADYLARVPLTILEAHIHDNLGDRDSHAHFGFGNVDFAQVAGGLKRAGFDGVATIEIAPRFHGSTPAESRPLARESLRQWRELWEATGVDG